MKKTIIASLAAMLICGYAFGQNRPYDKNGINVFETPKVEGPKYEGVKLKIGGSFTESWQALKHSNTSPSAKLIGIKPGFNTANANLYFDTQLEDGVSLNLTMYLSSRHHNETWVKGGYIQFDKFPFLHCALLDQVMKFTTLKVGHMEVNYGDAHFRRSDNGNSIYNPFIENYIMDEFSTEIGAEADLQHNGLLGVIAVTNGEIKGDISDYVSTTKIDSSRNIARRPAFIGKIGFDKQLSSNVRLRVTGSGYYTAGSVSNTLYGGDRGGSHYFGVLEKDFATTSAFSGRFNPGFTDKVASLMGNVFLKVGGLEWFTTLETSKGRSTKEAAERTASQFATDLLYRFGSSENFWVGTRYNTVKSELLNGTSIYDVNLSRIAVSGGWFLTKNIMTKLEYVDQKYKNFIASDIRNGGKFSGVVVEAVVSF
ncbi:MAG: hypothetical protein Q8928_02885 [Bacteroidota bacterium]|nr:hypothetical protein [Bacteroidota bacterium]